MADKHKPIVSTFGRPQGSRPAIAPLSTRPTDGERPLAGALSVPIEQVVPDPDQPCKTFDQGELDALAASIRAHGILQPLLVREDDMLDDGRTRYMIIAGGRRRLAAELAGLTVLPVIERASTGLTVRTLQLIENLQRKDLDPVEEARAFAEMMDLLGLDSARKLADHLHVGYTYVQDRLNLLVDETVAVAVQSEKVSFAVGVEVGRVADPVTRTALLRRAEVERWTKDQTRAATSNLREAERVASALADVRLPESVLREIAPGIGATDDHVRRANQARRDDPTLTPGDALRLAMVIDAPQPVPPPTQDPAAPVTQIGMPTLTAAAGGDRPAAQGGGRPSLSRTTQRPARPAYNHDELLALVARLGGRDNADAFLTWGMAQGFDIFTLRQLIRLM
jgi:ParB/RepB/Spo0J family partition protein